MLISHSPIGLQRLLNKLGKYCQEWELKVSMEKTKVIVFKKGSKLARSERWLYLGQKLDVVDEYKYLGVIFKSNGCWKKHIEEVNIKANRACTSLLKFVYKYRKLSITLFLRLFDSLVCSLLLLVQRYGEGMQSANLVRTH